MLSCPFHAIPGSALGNGVLLQVVCPVVPPVELGSTCKCAGARMMRLFWSKYSARVGWLWLLGILTAWSGGAEARDPANV